MAQKYFWKDTDGLKSDIERHRNEESELISKIDMIESLSSPDTWELARLRIYRNLLILLQQSKAEVVTKIGRKK
jgi:hypothetical protein